MNEQRMDFRVHNSTWEPIDFDGLKLMLRPSIERIREKGGNVEDFCQFRKTCDNLVFRILSLP